MTATKQFREAWLRVERAKKHVDDFDTALKQYNASDPYKVFSEHDRESNMLHYRARVIKPIPAEMALIASEAIHNCRAALDYLACDLALRAGAESTKGVYFPFANSREFFDSAEVQRKIRRLSEPDKAKIRALKPYRGGDDLLWSLHDLDRTDKHIRLMSIGAASGGTSLLPIAGTYMDIVTFTPNSTEVVPDEDIPLFSISADAIFQGKINFSVNVCFAEPEPLNGTPAGGGLQYFLNAVSAILIEFEV